MAPRKGQGQKKGKQPAPKPRQPPAMKKPRPQDGASSSSEDDECTADQQAILDQLVEMEQAFGISPGGPLPEAVSGRVTRQSVQRKFTSQVRNRLSLLHAQKQVSSVPGLGELNMSDPVQPVAPDRCRDGQGLPSQVIPSSQVQAVGTGEYLAPQNTNWVWPWKQGSQATIPSIYSSGPSPWGVQGVRPTVGPHSVGTSYMDASSPSGMGQIGQAGMSPLVRSSSAAAFPQYGMGVVPQASGLAHAAPPLRVALQVIGWEVH